jgi:hypothetical protein
MNLAGNEPGSLTTPATLHFSNKPDLRLSTVEGRERSLQRLSLGECFDTQRWIRNHERPEALSDTSH